MNNNFVLILLLFSMHRDKEEVGSGINSLSHFVSTMELDDKYTLEKIKIAQEIGPYLPKKYIPLLNESISITEKLIKINEVRSSIQKSEGNYISEHIPVNNNQDRFNKIISVMQKSSPRFKQTQVGTILDLLLNMDKYQKTFQILNTVIGKEGKLNNPAQLTKMIGPLLGEDEQEANSKLKEMTRMLEMMKILDSPKKKIT